MAPRRNFSRQPQINVHAAPTKYGNPMNVPSMPGQKLGMSPEQTRHFIENQVKGKGFSQQLTGGANTMALTLPAVAGFLCGISFDAAINATFKLTVNNTVIHENIAVIFATAGPTGGLGIQPYFGVNMPVNGQDDIKLDITCVGVPGNPTNVLLHYR